MRNVSRWIAAGWMGCGIPAGAALADVSSYLNHVDVNQARQDLVALVDLYNGGLQGLSGAGAYAGVQTVNPSWTGLFQLNLDRQFNLKFVDNMSDISQARAVYLNTAAYRADPAAGQRFMTTAQRGANYLFDKTYDTTDGGFFWGLDASGDSPPTSTSRISGIYPTDKMSYGQVHIVYALAHTFQITGDSSLLDDAYTGWNDYKAHFSDTANGTGAFLPSQDRTFTTLIDTRNIDYMTHALETAMQLYDATPIGDARRTAVTQDLLNIGNFITQLAEPVAGQADQAYIRFRFDGSWNPASGATVSMGHQVELAYLLSRGVERGGPAAWLDTANQLLNYGLAYGTDMTPGSPYYGAMLHPSVNPDGTPVGDPSVVWWDQAELARATLHFATLRGRSDLWDDFDAAWALINEVLVDSTYGGWYESVQWNETTQTWDIIDSRGTDKGYVWHVGYHETMLYDEMLRLALVTAIPEPVSLAPLGVGVMLCVKRKPIVVDRSRNPQI